MSHVGLIPLYFCASLDIQHRSIMLISCKFGLSRSKDAERCRYYSHPKSLKSSSSVASSVHEAQYFESSKKLTVGVRSVCWLTYWGHRPLFHWFFAF